MDPVEPPAELLSPVEARVLGSLMEKARTTPETYPLTLNSLVLACNQKTSREPVTDYDENEVLDTLDRLREKGLVMRVDMAGSRAPKFRENVTTAWQLAREEFALLATLFLRGPQTPGQLRQRSERLHPFADLQQVTDCLQRMQGRDDEPNDLVRALDRLAGTKEVRYAQILSPLPDIAEWSGIGEERAEPRARAERVPGELEEKVRQLDERLARLEGLMDELTR